MLQWLVPYVKQLISLSMIVKKSTAIVSPKHQEGEDPEMYSFDERITSHLDSHVEVHIEDDDVEDGFVKTDLNT